MSVQYYDLADYQKRAVGRDSHHIIVGGREVGKTEALVHSAGYWLEHNTDVVIVAPRNRMADSIEARVVEHTGFNPKQKSFENNFAEYRIYTERKTDSVKQYIRSNEEDVALLIDEPGYISDQQFLMWTYEMHDGPVLWAGTPLPSPVFEAITKYGMDCNVEIVEPDEAPHIKSDRLSDMLDGMPDEKLATEFTTEFV